MEDESKKDDPNVVNLNPEGIIASLQGQISRQALEIAQREEIIRMQQESIAEKDKQITKLNADLAGVLMEHATKPRTRKAK